MLLDEEFVFNSKSAVSEVHIDQFSQKLEDIKSRLFRETATDVLQNENAVRYFKFDDGEYCGLLKLILESIEDRNQFMNFMKYKNTFQRPVIVRDEFYANFLDIVLPKLIEVSAKFSQDEKVFEETSKLIQKCIFSKNLQEFDNYLANLFGEKKPSEKHSLCKILLKYFSFLYSNHETLNFGFKLIFHSFAKSSKHFSLTYKLILIISQIIGFELKHEFGLSKIKYQHSQPSLSKSLNVLGQLLDVVTDLKVDLNCKLNDVTFSEYLKNVLKSIMALSNAPDIHAYEIFLKTVEIDPLIVESVVNETIIYTMLSDNSKCQEQYEELMIKILEVFSKLHRIQNLISKMVPTLKSGIENRKLNETVYPFRGDLDIETQNKIPDNIDDIFPKSVLNYFTKCILHLASWQIINLFKTLLFHLNKAVEELPDIIEKSIYMEILSTLTCWILLSVRMAEHTVAPSTVVKFVGGLEELRTILSNFGKILLQREHNHVLMRSFLNICFYWAEIYMTLEYYSDNVAMIKHLDSNFSACNLTYLHSYLSDKEWCLISERISNFGGKPCKEIMQKLMIQKLKAFLTFGENSEDIMVPIIRDLSLNFDESSFEIFTDRFVVNHILEKMSGDNVITLADVIVKDLVEGKTEIFDQPHICDSRLIKDAILSVIITKINKLLKQKRKHDDVTIKKTAFSRIISILPSNLFLCSTIGEYLEKLPEIITSEDEQNLDIKIHEKKIEMYLNILTKVVVIFCDESSQKLLILLLLALHRDVKNSNCSEVSRKACESLIISILQHSKFTLLDLFNADTLVKLLTENFERYEDAFGHITQTIFKSDSAIASFESAVTYITDNIKENKSLRFAVILLNLLSKMKKIKISTNSKDLCLKYKSQICHKLLKLLGKKSPEDSLVEPYALVLKTFLTKDENDSLAKLRTSLNDYVEYSLCNLSDVNIKGALLLFTTILHHKTDLKEVGDDFILKIGDAMKDVNVKNDIAEDYSQLVILIATLIPNEQFTNIFGDLLENTKKSVEKGDAQDFYKHLKTWTSILRTNFNPIKTNLLREQLEFLLEKLILVLKSAEYKEELFEEVIQFEVSIIQANHVPLTAAIMDFFLLTVSILMMKKSHDFIHSFSCSISLLENLLKYRNPLIMDRLPPYLLQYRVLLKELCLRSSSNGALQPNEVQNIADCAHKLEKLTKHLVECTKDISRIAMYLIADILGQYEQDTLYPSVKKHLDNCIFTLISLCDQHAVQYLMRVLSNASTEIFKFMYGNYKKYYRFTGKV